MPERGEPVVIEFDFAALDELPCACIVRPFLDRVVYVADRNLVRDFIIKYRLEGTYYLKMRKSAILVLSSVVMKDGMNCVWEAHTTTPPISNRMAFGGLYEEAMMVAS